MVALASFVSYDCNDNTTVSLPFYPLWNPEGKGWKLWCVNLTSEGRCGDYDHRPALCRDFEPGQNSLCVKWEPPVYDYDQEGVLEKDPSAIGLAA